MPGYANPQNLNRFSYVRNNPLRYTDPTGHMLDDGCKEYGCDFGTSSSTSSSSGYTPSNNNNDDDDDAGDILDPNKDDDTTLPIPTITPSEGTLPLFTQTGSTQSSQICSTNPNGCIIGGWFLIVATDLFVGLPAIAVIVMTGGVTPPAIAAEALETFVVLPINIFGIYLIKQGLEAKNNQE